MHVHIDYTCCKKLKFKRLFKKVSYPILEIYYFIFLSLSILNKKVYYPTLTKHDFFLMNMKHIHQRASKSHVKKIKHSSSIYIVNFEMS